MGQRDGVVDQDADGQVGIATGKNLAEHIRDGNRSGRFDLAAIGFKLLLSVSLLEVRF